MAWRKTVIFLSLLTGLLNASVWGGASVAWTGERRGDRPSFHTVDEIALNGIAQSPLTRSSIAQNPPVQSLVGQCRRTGRLERIYDAANLAANSVGDLESDVTVTLAGDVNQPTFGWIRISAPLNGYIQTPFLRECDSGIAPLLECGIVIQPELAIKPSATTLSDLVGTLLFEQGFNITGAPQMQLYPSSQAGRIWVPIDRFGTAGWVTETSPDSYGSNFRRVRCESIGLEPIG